MGKNFIILSLWVLGTGALWAQSTPRTISVTGDAEVRVVPDRAVLSFGVETWGKDLTQARKENDDRMARILQIPAGFGIANKDVQTDWMTIDPLYDHDDEGRIQSIGSYRVRKNISLTIQDLGRLDALINAVLGAGANRFEGMEIQSSELRKYRDQARHLAVLAAREKASAMAGDLGQTLGKPLEVTENSSGGFPMPRAMTQNVMESYGGPSMGGETISVGQLVIRAQVSITFTLLDKAP